MEKRRREGHRGKTYIERGMESRDEKDGEKEKEGGK